MRVSRPLRPARATMLALAVSVAGCSGAGEGPNQPPPQDLSSPGAFRLAIKEAWSKRRLDDAMAILALDYRFYPARPANIPFLEPGATFWDHSQEFSILEQLLVEERTTWIDQVLLEITRLDERDLGGGRVEYDARVQLKLLIGASSFESAESLVTYVLQQDAEGDYHLVEEWESVSEGHLPIGELRARVLEDEGGGA